ncbi:MAG: hypothetical protein ACRDYC_14360, partial [Acidimicrobiales bacterium]
WVTISALATAGGTLVLAVATFSSVRSANRTARIAEESLLAGMRPLLMQSKMEDPPLKANFVDGHLVHIPGGNGTAEVGDTAIYLTISLRNAGTGIALLHGWRAETKQSPGEYTRPPVDSFRRLTRDLYVASGDVAYWQGAYRELDDAEATAVAALIKGRERIIIDLLYGDQHGRQRVITRFSLQSVSDDGWLAAVGRHWNVDRPDPR